MTFLCINGHEQVCMRNATAVRQYHEQGEGSRHFKEFEPSLLETVTAHASTARSVLFMCAISIKVIHPNRKQNLAACPGTAASYNF